MATAVITQHGLLPLPKEALDTLDVEPGDTVALDVEPDGVVRIHALWLEPAEVAGMLASKSHVKSTIEEMDEAVAEAFRKGEL